MLQFAVFTSLQDQRWTLQVKGKGMDAEDYKVALQILFNDLQADWEKFCESYDKANEPLIKPLLSRIGSVDIEGEGVSSAEGQRDLSMKFHWGHNHKFSPDLTVQGRMGNRHLEVMAQFMVGFELGDHYFSVDRALDVGCWTGGTTMSLWMKGAKYISALEEVNKYRDAASVLCNDIYSLNVDFTDGDLFGLKAHNEFNLAYFPGVVYHLSDPVLSLRRLFNALVIGGECLVESAGIDSDQPIARFEGNRRYHNTPDETESNLNRGGWNWFLPSPLCLQLWMEEAGFEEVKAFLSPYDGRVYARGVKKDHHPICQAGLSVKGI